MTPEEYKKYREKSIDSCIKNKVDSAGHKITHILVYDEEFIIYEIKTDRLIESIKTFIIPFTEKDENNRVKNFGKIGVKYNEIKGRLYKVNDDLAYKSIIANILSHGLSGDTDGANQQFEKLEEEIDKEYREQFNNRLRFLFSILGLTILSISLSIIVFYKGFFLDKVVVRHLMYVSSGALIGGLIAVSRRINETTFEKDVKPYLYILYGLERASIAIFFGIIVFFTIKSNIFLAL